MINESKKSIRKKTNLTEKSDYRIMLVKAAALLMVSIFVFGNLPGLKVSATGTITGTVFQDFNGNGNFDTSGGTAVAPEAIDVGVASITVTAYDSNGAAQGTATTIANGTYSLSTTGTSTGPYRLEFTTLPTGFQPSARSTNSLIGGSTTDSGSAVQFVADGNTANVNLAINRPEEFCQNNPGLAACRYNLGAQNGTYAANPVLQNFAYNSGTVYTDTTATNYDNPTTHTLNVTAGSVGSVFGLAYLRSTKRLYAAAFYKRYSGFGPGANSTFDVAPSTTSVDSSAIYVINPANNAIVSRFTVPAATNNNHSNATAADTTNASWDAVGKTSLGGIALADDESRLFVMNLENKTLYALNPTTGASLVSQAVPTPATCPAADVRPFAVKFYRGNVYVGMVCSAESTAAAANLRAYVYQVNPTTLAFGATPYSISLNYNRGFVNDSGATPNPFPAEWRPWNPVIQSGFSYPQPMLTDMEFTGGNLVLGIRDRYGDQGDDNSVRPGGETLRACGTFTAANFPGTLTLEANGRCGGTGNAPQNTGQGPGAAPATNAGSGEFYYQDDFSNPANGANFHDEVTVGGIAHIPGYNQTLTNAYDPISRIASDQTFDGGTRWFNNTTGAADKAYRLYDSDPNANGIFGKANGMGDLIALCDSAPIEIGNSVWRDANNNGVQDPQESRAVGAAYVSLAGITVRLYNSANMLVGTAVTDQDGEYYFTSGTAPDPNTTDNIGIVNGGILPNTAYQIRYDNAADFATGGVLAGLIPTRANATQQAGDVTSSDSDAVRVTNPTGSPTTGTFAVINYTTGAAGSNNHTLDAGFVTPVSIGSTVFNDPNNNGLFDTGETGIGSVGVELLYDANGDGVINGTELTTPVATTTTSTVVGSVGNYFFGNLTPGNYQVRIPTPPVAMSLSSTVTVTTDNQVENDDNGIQTGGAGGSTISPLINLTPGAEPLNAVESGQGGTQDDATGDANGDMTIDFGFLAPASIGDFVFSDVNRNGRQDAGEPGINGVLVTLYDNLGNAIATTTTATVGPNAGQYSFTGLAPGTYSVGFTLPTGFGYAFTLQDAAVATDLTDSDANVATGRTGSYTLIAGQSNTTVDAGLVQTVSLGNQVYNDANNDGIRNNAEVGIVGVTVNLYLDANDDGVADGAVIATTTTVANGLYLFSGLAPNTYIVGVVTPTNFIRSSINGGDPDTNAADNDNNGVLTVGNETRSNPVTLTLTGEPINESPSNDTNTPDNSSNLTVDFGFTPNYSLGNRLWFDTNNDGQINAGEVGINGVSVSIFASGNLTTALATTTTDSLGYYRFDNLYAGTYVVRVNPSNFVNGAALAGYQNTAGNTAAALDSTATAGQNGEDGINPTGAANTIQTLGISSNVITLGSLAAPTGETDVQASGQGTADNQANMTIDFGFFRMALSGTIWNDNGAGGTLTANDGFLNGTEPGIIGVRVQIYTSANVEILVGPDGILGTSDDAAGGVVTTSTGNYSFQGLPAGSYRVVVTANGATSSTGIGNNTNPDTNVDSDDNGFPDNTGNFAGRTISGLVTVTPGNAGTLSNNTITNTSGTTSNPTVDFGFVLSPTVVQLDNFDVYTDGSSVELRWSTGNESGNLGFNVYREVNGKRQMLNSAPIAGNALRSSVEIKASGNDYSWTDKAFNQNAVYYLEDLDVDGSASLHGAAMPQFRQTIGNQPNARMFSDLANVEGSTGSKEIVSGDASKVSVPTVKAAALLMARQQQIAALGGAKITVKHDGWYRVTAQELQATGFDINSNPQVWQLYTDGAEVPFKLNSDSIEFFGRGLDTPLTDKQVYYLISGQSNGLRINAVNGGAANENADAQSFGVTVERRDRTVYVSSILNGDADNWFGAIVSRSNQTVQNLNAVNIDEGGRAHLSLKLQGVVAVDHAVSVRFNDTELGTVEFSNFENKQFEFDVPASAMREGVNKVYLQANGAGSDVSLVDTIRLSYQRGYTATNNRIRFSIPAGQTARVSGFSDGKISVYELRNGAATAQVVGASENVEGNHGFSLALASADREMIAVVNSTVETASVENNAPSTWNNARNQADFVIVTSSELRESADNLASMRQSQGLRTNVVLVDDLFDEFTFGRRDPQAVKQFLQTAATKWQTKPQYALLFGDSSYDTRNNLGLTATRDIVPTKSVDTANMETASDSWLADFDNDGAEDIALGRLPVGNASEAAAAVEKLARFDRQGARQQKTDVLVADRDFESYSAALQTILPRDVNAFRIDRSAMTDAETHQNIIERLNDNPLLVTYTGHGSQSVWAGSGIFNSNDAAGLSNRDLSFYVLMNCLNGYTHQPTGDGLAEILFRSPNGAIAVWASSGITESANQAAMSQAFTNFAFNARTGKSLRVGDVVKAAKRVSTDSDVRRTWQLIGDPTTFVR